MNITERAPGKLILIGEYTVLEGAPSLVMAVDRYANVSLSGRDDGFYSISAAAIGVQQARFHLKDDNCIVFAADVKGDLQKRLTFFRTTFEYAWHYLRSCGCKLQPCDIVIDTEGFYDPAVQSKLGFGSSAALTVALIRALFRQAGRNLADINEQEKTFRLALSAHKRAQGNLGSGIDIAASAFGGTLQYTVGINKKAQQFIPKRLPVWKELPFLVLFTGHSESTRRMVSGVKQLKAEKPDLYKTLIDDLAQCSSHGCEAYSNKELKTFLKSIESFYTLLDNLGGNSGMPIISDSHRAIARWAKEQGAVYKPSGAGSGDIGVAFAKDMAALEKLSLSASEHGLVPVDVATAEPL